MPQDADSSPATDAAADGRGGLEFHWFPPPGEPDQTLRGQTPGTQKLDWETSMPHLWSGGLWLVDLSVHRRWEGAFQPLHCSVRDAVARCRDRSSSFDVAAALSFRHRGLEDYLGSPQSFRRPKEHGRAQGRSPHREKLYGSRRSPLLI